MVLPGPGRSWRGISLNIEGSNSKDRGDDGPDSGQLYLLTCLERAILTLNRLTTQRALVHLRRDYKDYYV